VNYLPQDQKAVYVLFIFSEPNAEILGDGDIYAQAGSPLNITCVVNYLPQDQEDIRWVHEGQVSYLFSKDEFRILIIQLCMV
jgi:hypothetical protein